MIPQRANVLPPHATMPTIVYKVKSDYEVSQEAPQEVATVNGRHSKPTSNKRSDGDESSSDSSSIYSGDGEQYTRLDKKNPFESSSAVEAQQTEIPSEISHFDKLRLEAKYGKARKQEPQPVPSLLSYNPFAVELAQQRAQQHDSSDERHNKVTTWKNSSSHDDKENIADSSNAQGDSKKVSSSRIVNVALDEIFKQTENDAERKKTTDAERNLNNERQKKVFDFLSQYVTRTSVTMPHPKLRECTNKRFFDVQLLEFVSPSLFTFQFDLSGYKSLTEEMK